MQLNKRYMDVLKLKHIIIMPNVQLTGSIARVLLQLDSALELYGGFKMWCISGKRSAERQLKIMRDYAFHFGIYAQFPEAMKCLVDDKVPANIARSGEVYVWQGLWSRLTKLGIIISPCRDAVALEDYKYIDGRNLKGLLINASNHISGNAVDFAGGENGVSDETKAVEWGISQGIIKDVLSVVPERNNNCLHLNCRPI